MAVPAIVSVFAVILVIGSLSIILQHGLDVTSVAVGLFAMLLVGLSVYFSPVPHKLSELFRSRQSVKHRQARHHLRHLKKVNRLVQRIDQGAAYHLGADGEIILDKSAKHEADGDNEGETELLDARLNNRNSFQRSQTTSDYKDSA